MQVIDNKRVKFREFGKWWFDKHGVLLCPFEDHATLNSLILDRGLKSAATFLESFYSNIHSFFTIISSKVPLYYILKNDELLTLNCLPIRDIEQLTKIVLCDLTEESMLETPDGKRAIELFVLIQDILNISMEPVDWTYEKLCLFFQETLKIPIETPEAKYIIFALTKSKDPEVQEILSGKGTQQEKVDAIDQGKFWEKCDIKINQNINEAFRLLSAFQSNLSLPD